MSVQIFLSAVSDEFYDYREQLRGDLIRHNVEVKVQEDFKDSGTVTLDKLDVYIGASDAVIHLVGDMTGEAADAASTVAIVGKYSNLVDKLAPLRLPLENHLGISYTQWEAWLALYHDKHLLIAKADAIAPRGRKFEPTDFSCSAQQAHLALLQAVGRYPAFTFYSRENLAKQSSLSFILDLLAAELSAAASTGNVDRNKLKDLQMSLKPIVDGMIAVNANKRTNVEALRDYIDKSSSPSKWEDITRSCKDISAKLQQVIVDIEKKQGQILNGISFSNAGDLRGALQYQDKIYQ